MSWIYLIKSYLLPAYNYIYLDFKEDDKDDCFSLCFKEDDADDEIKECQKYFFTFFKDIHHFDTAHQSSLNANKQTTTQLNLVMWSRIHVLRPGSR